MQYVTRVGRIGIKKGLQQGLRQGKSRLSRRLLIQRFGELPLWMKATLQEVALEQIEAWGEWLSDAGRLKEIFRTDIEH